MDLAGYIQELHFEIHDCVRAAIAKESAASLYQQAGFGELKQYYRATAKEKSNKIFNN
jgi:hypothetical protein